MKQKVQMEIDRLVNILIKEQKPNGSWSYPFETGITTDCYMIILLRSLELNDEDFIQSLVERILSKQGANGAWKLFYDEDEGNLSLTVEAYFAILYSGYRTKNDREMYSARQFILKNGGLKHINMFTKTMLSLTGQYTWPKLFPIPIEIMLLPVSFPMNIYDFSIYTRINLIPIMITANYKYSVQTNRTPDLSDLFVQRINDDWDKEIDEWRSLFSTIQQEVKSLLGFPHELQQIAINRAEQYMLQRIEKDGTLYSYFSSTFYMIYALLARGYSKQHPIILKAISGLKGFQTKIDDHTHIQFTTATVWNTALISYSLQEAGVASSSEIIQKAQQYLLAKQQYLFSDWAIKNPTALPGGWGFSDINTLNPDIDDTSASLRAIRSLILKKSVHRQAWERGIQWIMSMQNDDGGWAAFEKNIDKPYLAWLPVEGGGAMILDPSTVDLTGRTLEFFGNDTRVSKDHPFIKRAIKWLLRNQEADGSWYGRWGICYIYGTWAAITGLVAVQTRSDHQAIQKAIRWLSSIQNPNGGWGESCKSDSHKKYVSLNESTRTHTAWALDALISAENKVTTEIERGITYLLDTSQKEDWTTTYPKGQGLANNLYMHYHSYEYLFPLLALSHFKNKFW